jgi:hypothetical protein
MQESVAQVSFIDFVKKLSCSQNHHDNFPKNGSKLQVITVAQYLGKKDNHLSFDKNEVITVRDQQGPWWSGELNGKIGWFPKAYVKQLENGSDKQPTPIKTTGD